MKMQNEQRALKGKWSRFTARVTPRNQYTM